MITPWAGIALALAIHGAEPAGPLAEATVEWEPAAGRPWLEEVDIEAEPGSRAPEVAALPAEGGYRGVSVRVPGGCRFRVRLASGTGFRVDPVELSRRGFFWFADLGLFVSATGRWSATERRREEMVQAARGSGAPFLTASEEYWKWAGLGPNTPKADGKVWDFLRAKADWPPRPRARAAIRELPEASHEDFAARVGDVSPHRMFLGWPGSNWQFVVEDNGAWGAYASSNHATGFEPAPGYELQLAAGDRPDFPGPGSGRVRQRLDGGWRPIITSSREEDGLRVEATLVAHPLGPEAPATGDEPLGSFARLSVRNAGPMARKTRLWIRIAAEGRGGPALDAGTLRLVREGEGALLLAGEEVLGAAPRAGALEEAAPPSPAEHPRPCRLLSLPLEIAAGETRALDLVFAFRAVPRGDAGLLRGADFDRALSAARGFWDARLAEGARVQVPDPKVNDMYRTLLPRELCVVDTSREGLPLPKTSPMVYESIWSHCTSYGIAESLARRGHFGECRRLLDTFFAWQDTPLPDSPDIDDAKGFFGVPPRFAPGKLVWVNFHGWVEYAAARYFLLSRDERWFREKLPGVLASLEWTRRLRDRTKRRGPDGAPVENHGLVPRGRVTDGSSGTSLFNDASLWQGMAHLAEALAAIDHPQAPRWRKEAEEYRSDILRAYRRASASRAPARLNDGTYVPYLPAYLEGDDFDRSIGWYAAVVDGPFQEALYGGILAGEPEEGWLLDFLNDDFYLLSPGLADEPFFAGQLNAYARRDEPEMLIHAFYSLLTNGADRETLTTYEHRSWGSGRVFDLIHWSAGNWDMGLWDILCRAEGRTLRLCPATPRRWLAGEEGIRVEKLQTEFGPVSFEVSPLREGRIQAAVSPPARGGWEKIVLRLRHPTKERLRSALVDGEEWKEIDPGREEIRIPFRAGARFKVEARYR